MALLDRSERNHRCAEIVAELDVPLVTCEAVIAETCYLLHGLRGAADAVLENVQSARLRAHYRCRERSRTSARR